MLSEQVHIIIASSFIDAPCSFLSNSFSYCLIVPQVNQFSLIHNALSSLELSLFIVVSPFRLVAHSVTRSPVAAFLDIGVTCRALHLLARGNCKPLACQWFKGGDFRLKAKILPVH